jgi:hypothetical protein
VTPDNLIIPPVVLIIFNRPDLVELQCERLRTLAIEQLFVIADGPRKGTDDQEKCEATRAIVDSIEWPYAVRKNYANTNMGCANRIVSGLDWVFSSVDCAIILEDDCLAHHSFFQYCAEMLVRYQNDDNIMQVCGTNPLLNIDTPYSYRFSHHVFCWGWATWARAWSRNDLSISLSKQEIRRLLKKYLQGNRIAIDFWSGLIDKTRRGQLDAWDYPWQLSVWHHGGSSILPNRNLIMNAGFRDDATHTKNTDAPLANLPLQEMVFPLGHPPDKTYGYQFDIRFIELGPGRIRNKGVCREQGRFRKLFSRIKRRLKRMVHA